MNDEELVANVIDELFWDPKVDSEAISASADSGIVTLRGTVGSFREKREAQKAAERVWGVVSVRNEIKVRLMGDRHREDADLRGDVLQAPMLDSLVPMTVDVSVNDGAVTLTGTVDWRYQRDEAQFIAGNLIGVVGVANSIYVSATTPSTADIQNKIKKAFTRNAQTVTLSGTVRSWGEHDAAVAAACAAPAVKVVDDQLTVAH